MDEGTPRWKQEKAPEDDYHCFSRDNFFMGYYGKWAGFEDTWALSSIKPPGRHESAEYVWAIFAGLRSNNLREQGFTRTAEEARAMVELAVMKQNLIGWPES